MLNGIARDCIFMTSEIANFQKLILTLDKKRFSFIHFRKAENDAKPASREQSSAFPQTSDRFSFRMKSLVFGFNYVLRRREIRHSLLR